MVISSTETKLKAKEMENFRNRDGMDTIIERMDRENLRRYSN